jgi:hypothetical protein
MRASLKRQELVHRRDRGRICGADAHFGATRAITLLITYRGAPRGHDRRPWHDARVHLKWFREISRRERRGDLSHVLADGRDLGPVRFAGALEDDATAIGEILKDVRRRVLIYPHHRPAARLRGRERGIRPTRGRRWATWSGALAGTCDP